MAQPGRGPRDRLAPTPRDRFESTCTTMETRLTMRGKNITRRPPDRRVALVLYEINIDLNTLSSHLFVLCEIILYGFKLSDCAPKKTPNDISGGVIINFTIALTRPGPGYVTGRFCSVV